MHLSAFIEACRSGKAVKVQEFLDYIDKKNENSKINETYNYYDNYSGKNIQETALCVAVVHGNEEIVRILINSRFLNIKKKSEVVFYKIKDSILVKKVNRNYYFDTVIYSFSPLYWAMFSKKSIIKMLLLHPQIEIDSSVQSLLYTNPNKIVEEFKKNRNKFILDNYKILGKDSYIYKQVENEINQKKIINELKMEFKQKLYTYKKKNACESIIDVQKSGSILHFSNDENNVLYKRGLKENTNEKLKLLNLVEMIFTDIEKCKKLIMSKYEHVTLAQIEALEKKYKKFLELNLEFIETRYKFTSDATKYFEVFFSRVTKKRNLIVKHFKELKSRINMFKKEEKERKKHKNSKKKEEFEKFEEITIKNAKLFDSLKKEMNVIDFIRVLFGIKENYIKFNNYNITNEMKHLKTVRDAFEAFNEAFNQICYSLNVFDEKTRLNNLKLIGEIEKNRKIIVDDTEFSYFKTEYLKKTRKFSIELGFESLKQLLKNCGVVNNNLLLKSLQTSKKALPLEEIINKNRNKVRIITKWDNDKVFYSILSKFNHISTIEMQKKEQELLQELKNNDYSEIPRKEVKICKEKDGSDYSIGVGGFGEVFKGELFGKIDVAIKTITVNNIGRENGSLKKQIKAELKFLKLFKNNENVLKVYGFYVIHKNKIGIIMEYIENGSLDKLIEKKTLNNGEKWMLIKEMIQCVQTLHKKEVIHRDIKPSNFLVLENNSLKICDFGLAKLENSQRTTSIGIKGTKRFIPKEIHLADIPNYTKESDIYGLGMTIYNLVVEKIPFFNAQNETKFVVNIMTDKKCSYPPNINPVFKTIIEKCTKINPNERCSLKELIKFMKKRELEFLSNNPLPKSKEELLQTKLNQSIFQKNELEDEKRCCICLENLKNIILYPCKHICLCEECSSKFKYKLLEKINGQFL